MVVMIPGGRSRLTARRRRLRRAAIGTAAFPVPARLWRILCGAAVGLVFLFIAAVVTGAIRPH